MSDNEEVITCEFDFKCPKRWEDLTPTEDRDVRLCSDCERPVRFLHNLADYERFLDGPGCFAVNTADPRFGGPSVTVGAIAVPADPGDIDTRVFLEPVTYLSAEQLRVVRRLSGLNLNLLETRQHFADGARHFLVMAFSAHQLDTIAAALAQHRVPFTTEAT